MMYRVRLARRVDQEQIVQVLAETPYEAIEKGFEIAREDRWDDLDVTRCDESCETECLLTRSSQRPSRRGAPKRPR